MDMPVLDHGQLAGGLLLAAFLLAAEYWAKELSTGMPPHVEASRREGAVYRRTRVWRAAALAVLLALAFCPGWWILAVVCAHVLAGSAELLVSRLQSWLRSHSRSSSWLGSYAGSCLAWLQLTPMLLILGIAALTSRWVAFAPGALSMAVWRATGAVFCSGAGMTPLRLAAVFAAFVFLGSPSNHIVRCMLGKGAGAISQEDDTYPDPATVRAGRAIGTLERWIMTIFLALGQYSAMGLTLTAKSIVRFSKIEKDPAFAEYYLLGTLYSMLLALLVGLALKVVLL
ncbi:MAG: hypothetical protein KA064_00300 [Firmicutes bacterium]|nr:hypothetical protein [Bacillota bacterium]